MYEYRLTRRAKIVITSFIVILFSVTGLLSRGIIARAQNNLVDKQTIGTGFEAEGIAMENRISEKSYELSYTSEVMGTSYFDSDNREDDVLRIGAEQAYVYEGKKVAFLTFDDGPSKNITPQVLDVLEKYNVRATFFVLGSLSKSNGTILKDIANRGHAIGIHTYSHNYKEIYKNVNNFANEISMTEAVLKQTLGKEFHTRLFRFPGGSFEGFKNQYKDLLKQSGYVSVDWNALSGDGEAKGLSSQKLFERLKATSEGKQQLVVLMHDSSGKQATVDALPGIIEYLKSRGYEFAVLK